MARRKDDNQRELFSGNPSAPKVPARHKRVLILPHLLATAAEKITHVYGEQIENALRVLAKWADFERDSRLAKKETSLNADFLHDVFGGALGYTLFSDAEPTYQLEREFSVPGVGTADGALGEFAVGRPGRPVALIELKSADCNLDLDKFNGRTPVQQCWDYLNALPDCEWGIVSNFVTTRLYHRDAGSRAYQEFALQDLRTPERVAQFYVLLGRGSLLSTKLDPTPRAVRLLNLTGHRQREVGDELYAAYSRHRLELIRHLHTEHEVSVDRAISIAQKLLDRIIFVAFCEDRALLPDRIIERTYSEIPPLARVTNPRWQNFLDLFRAINQGHRKLYVETGYDGGLFRHDPDVDDLQLDDSWTGFFKSIGGYDFRDEVNVDVLGHIFEKSVTELEKLRSGGFFTDGNGAPPSRMPKSAQRKRFGIYYTPVEFTTFLVDNTLGDIVGERFARCARETSVDPQASPAEPPDKARIYWNRCLDVLRNLRICDPACGSGAFLIRAYDFLEEQYLEVLHHLVLVEDPEARSLADQIPDLILAENLYGVDVSVEAVEISQLALWIRSARRGRTLADLSQNIVCGNSLVDDAAVHPRAMNWRERFPGVFDRPEAGFDCVIGNPPWERLKLQEREFFSFSAPEIAEAVNAADRRKRIAGLESENPALYNRYREAKRQAECTLDHARTSGRFPLTGKGDINTYALFAELARDIVGRHGRVGVLVPSGIASDRTTSRFFNTLINDGSLLRLYDFENRKKIFPDVDGRFKFTTLVFAGEEASTSTADFVFFAHSMDDLEEKDRHIELSAEDFALLNPNTRTCPVFRSRRDADITKAIYSRVPVLIDRTRTEGGNPWGVRFLRMFDQTNDAEFFHTPDQLAEQGFKLEGNRWVKRKKVFLPLYEAKMIQAYDHRAAGVLIEKGNWVRQGQTQATSLVSHQNPEFAVQPRWWVDSAVVAEMLKEAVAPAYLAYKDVTSPTNERTMIAAFIPHVGVVNSAPLLLCDVSIGVRLQACLLANLNSIVLDFAARQKVGNVHLNYFVVEQLPVFGPDKYPRRCPWNQRQTLQKWISDRVLKLTCTANDMRPLAEAAGFKKGVQKWRNDERAQLRAELDAAYSILYGLSRNEVEYVLSTFTGTARRDEAETGSYRTAELILEAFDALSDAC